MTDLNNKIIGTKSQKIRKISVLLKHIIDTVDNSQEVKRLMNYLTLTPLSSTGKGYDGKIIKQPDLTHSLLKDYSVNGVVVYEKVLFDSMFNSDIETLTKNQIFVHSPISRINDKNNTQRIEIYIDILIAQNYEYLQNYGEKRTYEIAGVIADLLDGIYIENSEIVDIVGNVKTVIDGSITTQRLSKTNNTILVRVPIVVDCMAIRIREDV